MGLCALATTTPGRVEVRERRIEVVCERPEREVRVVHETEVKIGPERRDHEHDRDRERDREHD